MDYSSLDLHITRSPEVPSNVYRASILEDGNVVTSNDFELRQDLKLFQFLKGIEDKVTVFNEQFEEGKEKDKKPEEEKEEEPHIEFGKMLYGTVFSRELGDYFNNSVKEAQENGCGLRISLRFDETVPEIASMPWEYLHDNEGFLITRRNILISRLPAEVRKTELKPLESALRMLVIISAPEGPGIPPLNTEKEQEIILEAVDNLQKDQKIKVDFTEDATFENIQGYLNEQTYHIVHFTGHGAFRNGKGHLLFETEDRKARYVDKEAFSELISGRETRLVVLSSCESAKGSNKEAFADLASTLSKRLIPAVVAMQYSVLDEVATKFAYTFYRTLAGGSPVDLSLKEARISMKNLEKSNGLDFATPVLYLSDHTCIQTGKIKPESEETVDKPMLTPDLQVMKKGFVARKKELRILEKGFKSDVKRVAIIHGFGGLGKTVLATRFALKMNEINGYFDGTLGIRGTSSILPEEILDKINNFLMMAGKFELNQYLKKSASEGQPVPLEVKTSKLANILKQNRFLIIFDNFEDCLNEDRTGIENPELKTFISQLLNETYKGTKFIITTRYDFDPLEGRLTEGIEHISLPELHFPQANWLMNNHTVLADLSIRKKRNIYDKVTGGHPWTISQFAILASSQGVDDLLLELEPLQKKLIEFTLLDKSYSKLDEPARKLLLSASIYEEAVPVEALSWIVGDEKDASPSVGEPLQKLLQWGLISKEQEYGKTVYSEHTIVKDFALKKLEEDGLDKKELLIRAARFYENLATQSRNIWDKLKARDYYFQAEDWESASEVVENTSNLLIRWGHIERAMNLLNDSINTTSGNTRTNSEYTLATIYYHLGDFESALRICNNTKQKFVNSGDKSGIASTVHLLGMIQQEQGNYEEAVKMYSQCLKLDEELGDKRGIATTLFVLGNINYLQGNYQEAVKLCDQSLKIAKDVGDKKGIAGTLHQLGGIHQEQGDYQEAVKLCDQSLKIFEDLGDNRGIATTVHLLGVIFQEKGNYEEAVKMYNQALKIFDKMGAKSGTASTLHQLGNIHYLQCNYQKAVKMYIRSLKMKEELGAKSGTASTLHQLGNIHCDQGNYEEATKMYNKSLQINEELGNKSGIAGVLHELGNIHRFQGNYEEATKMYNQSLKMKEELGDKSGIAATLHTLGNIHYQQGNYKEATKMYNQSLKMKEELGDKSGIAATLHTLGNIHCDQGNYEEATKMYNKSLQINEELGDKSGIAGVLHELGIIYQQQGNYEEAVKKYNQSRKMNEELGDKSGIAATIDQLGSIHYLQRNYEEAIKMHKNALKIEKELGDKSGIAKTLHQLGMIHQDQGNYDEAVKKYNESLKMKEELGDKSGIAITLHQIGRINEEEEEYSSALRNYFISVLIFEQLNSSNKEIVVRSLSRLRDKMGEEEFDAEFEKLVKK